jgi:hypothetical protein
MNSKVNAERSRYIQFTTSVYYSRTVGYQGWKYIKQTCPFAVTDYLFQSKSKIELFTFLLAYALRIWEILVLLEARKDCTPITHLPTSSSLTFAHDCTTMKQ